MNGLCETIRADLQANRLSRMSMAFMVLFRVGQALHRKATSPSRLTRIFWKLPYICVNTLYKVTCHSFGCYMPLTVKLGKGVFLRHGMYGIFISYRTVIGENVTLLQQITIGSNIDTTDSRSPTIGNRVFIGAGARIIGPVTVGDDAKIGANAIVVNDVPSGATAVSPKAVILPAKTEGDS